MIFRSSKALFLQLKQWSFGEKGK